MTLDVPGVGEELKISYKLIEGATEERFMVDSLGYTYNKKALGKRKTQLDKGGGSKVVSTLELRAGSV